MKNDRDDYRFDEHDWLGVICGIALVAMFVLIHLEVLP